MDYNKKISISKAKKNSNMVLICIIASISLLGLVMAVYSIVNFNFIFALVYIIAVIMGFSYVVMRINTIMPTYIEINGKYVYIQNWDNGLFPFVCDKGILGEFFPAKTLIKKIDIDAISKIYLGSRNYILKLIPHGIFYSILKNPDNKYQSMLKRMDFLYIITKDDKEIYMSITDFDDEELASVIKPIVEKNEKVDFRSNNRVVTKLIPAKKISL